MKLTIIQRYYLNFCLNYFRNSSQHQALVELLKEILNETQTRDDFKKNILALIKLSSEDGPSKQVSIYILLHFMTPALHRDIFIEIVQEHGVRHPRLTAGEYGTLIAQLNAQKFPPALPENEAAQLGYAPSMLSLAKKYRDGFGIERNLKVAREFYMQAFEQGIEDDESIYEYTMCFENNKQLDRSSYLWHILIERKGKYSTRARTILHDLTLGFNSNLLKTFQELLKEATPVENTEKGGPVTFSSFGNPRAQALVGFCYHIGLGIEQNITKAIHFYKLSRNSDMFWDLFACFKRELKAGSITIKEVLEFYKQHLDRKDCASEHYMIPANLILARLYHEGITGVVYPNLSIAHDYYDQALKLIDSAASQLHWKEENQLAKEGIKPVQLFLSLRAQIVSSLEPHGITSSLCNLTAEYCDDFSVQRPLSFFN